MFATLFGRSDMRHELRPLLESGQTHQYGGTTVRRQSTLEPAYEDEDDGSDADPPALLPLFESSRLDAIPMYDLTHLIRFLVVPRCETTLSWDQLRSPQVSAFLIKPIQEEILREHFSRGTLYALLANSLQFSKEAATYPGISGASYTRAMVCELLAIKLLKEYSNRELIDALSYDFNPLQGLPQEKNNVNNFGAPAYPQLLSKERPRPVRISTLEVALRAQAKRFLAHPLVVQHLEAIWAGNIVFYSSADSLHRQFAGPQTRHHTNEQASAIPRRTVNLYDPRHASLLKLSRLRVPRYRQFLSTCSLLALLILFVLVLGRRSTKLTPLEVIFWIWSTGFTLDEVVHFTEQGFGLHVLSFWNAYDMGILLVLGCYYCIRIVSVFATDSDQDAIASISYDVLALDAILLFPRLFSVLDHSRYFSQLLIAFRLMIVDLLAILALIAIACSGFFVAFSLSFGNRSFEGDNVAFALFQILMGRLSMKLGLAVFTDAGIGFTPAAWDQWPRLNYLGQAAMVAFLCIGHFLVVTILITVLTNSFMAIVRNAHDEHQFVFAVNTITMVKSDALFSYVAPANVLAWSFAPLRYFVSFRRFVWLNRVIIKVTHFPILFGIFAYEKMFIGSRLVDTDDQTERPNPNRSTLAAFAREQPNDVHHERHSRLRREQSVATFQDRALDEVFREQGPEETLTRPLRPVHRAGNAVSDWMHEMGPEGQASPPVEQDQSVLAHLEQPPRRRNVRRVSSDQQLAGGSDPEVSHDTRVRVPTSFRKGRVIRRAIAGRALHDTDSENDEELHSNEELGEDVPPSSPHLSTRSPFRHSMDRRVDGASHHSATSRGSMRVEGTRFQRQSRWSPLHRPHKRTLSNTTILFNPLPEAMASQQSHLPGFSPPLNTVMESRRQSRSVSPRQKGRAIPSPGRKRRRSQSSHRMDNAAYRAMKPRSIVLPRDSTLIQPNTSSLGLLPLDTPRDRMHRSSLALDLASDLGDNKAAGQPGAFPASFGTHFAWPAGRFAHDARGDLGRPSTAQHGFASNARRPGHIEDDDAADRLNRLVLVRMNTLEAGFREVLHEVKDWKRNALAGGSMSYDSADAPLNVEKTRKAKMGIAGKAAHSTQGDLEDDAEGDAET